MQRSFANTNFTARLKFPAATVATTTTETSVLRVGVVAENLYVLPGKDDQEASANSISRISAKRQ